MEFKQTKKDILDEDGVEYDDTRLFPDFLPQSTASATESTGLIQIGMATEEEQKVYDDVYSYRQKKALHQENAQD